MSRRRDPAFHFQPPRSRFELGFFIAYYAFST